MKIASELKDEIKKIAITEKEKDRILESSKTQFRVKDYYNEILNSAIVTVGHEAKRLGVKISEAESKFIGNVSYQINKYGIFDKILKKRDKNHKISESCKVTYNVIENAEIL